MTRPSEDDLHASADGCLPPERREAMARHLAADPQAAEQVAFYRRLNDGLHRLYDPLLAEALPEGLAAPRRRLHGAGKMMRVAAAVGLLLIGAAGGWLARGLMPGDLLRSAELDLPRLAADAHIVYAAELRHAVEVGAEQEAHLVAWLSKRLGDEVKAPDLSRLGYRLMGGRLLPAGDGAAGQFMYEDEAGARLTLFLAQGGRSTDAAFHFVEEDGVSVFYWRDRGFGYALSAELPRDGLLPICNEVYAQLNPGADAPRW